MLRISHPVVTAPVLIAMYQLLSIASVPLLASLVHGYANPGACSGVCTTHDPGLIRRESDGTYFLFSTGNKISYVSASSIEGPWTSVGSMLPDGSSIDLDGNDDLWVTMSHSSMIGLADTFPGARCFLRRWSLLCILRRVDLWIPRLRNRTGNV